MRTLALPARGSACHPDSFFFFFFLIDVLRVFAPRQQRVMTMTFIIAAIGVALLIIVMGSAESRRLRP